ncbi:hypothetical protein VC83_09025 [Pseudogymnoascus destructans]|uniref:Uncharacterized protein n=1 Tax=Pseudogymnoascus destructans TaxID=655981 RepID=A0A176ZWY0_9PEZI|nr:uncharacterized protein VC83_09025 [Pseudogymnoascus destructans]OAF54495.1 hypothetical protein VC83_09025 [Pseudogymnoascus destructans]
MVLTSAEKLSRNSPHNSSKHAQLYFGQVDDQPWHVLIPTAVLATVLSFPKSPEKNIQDNPNAQHEQTYLRCTKPSRVLSTPRPADAPALNPQRSLVMPPPPR